MIASLIAAVAVALAADPLPKDPAPTTGVANPAVTDATLASTICRPNWTKPPVRPPARFTNRLKAAQLPPGANLRLYEEDHVWPIEDGGAPRDPANLRPQYWTGPDGARAKDVVETNVHRAICRHEMTLAEGHAVLAAWILAHRPYPILAPGAPH